jgi:hypothetical protein
MNMPKPQTEKTINVIRGKNLVGKTTSSGPRDGATPLVWTSRR